MTHRLACGYTAAEQLPHYLNNITHIQGLIVICAISQSPFQFGKAIIDISILIHSNCWAF